MKSNTVVVSEAIFGGQDEMEEFLETVERITSTPVVRVREWRLTSDSPHAMTVLAALVEAAKKPTKATLKTTPIQKIRQYEKSLPQESLADLAATLETEPERIKSEMKSWSVVIDGKTVEAISLTEKNRRLAAGDFETGSMLRHPRAGLQRVTGVKGMPQGMEPES